MAARARVRRVGVGITGIPKEATKVGTKVGAKAGDGEAGAGKQMVRMDGTAEVGKSSFIQVGAICGVNYSNWMNKT